MTFLYSCRHDGQEYRITKLTENLDVESSYLCTFDECQCPAAEKGRHCRHMDMLPKFVQRGAIDTGWMLDYDRGGWVDMRTQEEIDQPVPLEEQVEEDYPEGTEVPNITATEVNERIANLKGPENKLVEGMVNAVYDKVVATQPALIPVQPPSWRRF